MATQEIYSLEDLQFAKNIINQNPDLENKIKDYWQRFNSKEYNAKPIEEKAKDINEFYDQEAIIVHPVDLGVLGLAIAIKTGNANIDEVFPAGPLIRADFYYRTQETRKLNYGDLIGEWLNRLLRKSDENQSNKFSQENFFHYILNGKSIAEKIKQQY